MPRFLVLGLLNKRRRVSTLGVYVLLALAATTLKAQTDTPAGSEQDTPPPPSTASSYKLRVYANRIQIPTLVLDPFKNPSPRIDPRNLAVRIDGGPPFRPANARLEGDDPIDLAILLDLSGSQSDLLPFLAESLAALTPRLLLPHDHVSVFAYDCTLIRSRNDFIADPTLIRKSIEDLLHTASVHGPNKTHPACSASAHLWDDLAYVINDLSASPGRRVVLALTDGADSASRVRPDRLTELANSRGVAVFGMAVGPFHLDGVSYSAPHGSVIASGYSDDLVSISESSGGLVLSTEGDNPARALTRFMTMLRGRYIIEFPRPDDLEVGAHRIEVTLKGPHVFIRPSGITVPASGPHPLAGQPQLEP